MDAENSVTSGLVIVDKPSGMTSHDVVARLRRIVGTRKVGHAGTLDPMATGVLIAGVGRATKLLGYVLGHDKTYRATVRLGQRTSTDDREGEVLSTADTSHISRAQIERAFGAQVGRISQVPSAVSAIKVDGRRAYDLVRAGHQVELTAREVTISSIEILRVVTGAAAEVDVEVHCGAGTYIRAIARDVGAALGVGGHLAALRRTAIGAVDESAALSLEQLSQLENPVTVPLDEAVRRTFPVRRISAEHGRELGYGRGIGGDGSAEEVLGAIDPDGHAIALVDGRGKPKVVFVPA